MGVLDPVPENFHYPNCPWRKASSMYQPQYPPIMFQPQYGQYGPPQNAQPQFGNNQFGNNMFNRTNVQCFSCGRYGHISRNCSMRRFSYEQRNDQAVSTQLIASIANKLGVTAPELPSSQHSLQRGNLGDSIRAQLLKPDKPPTHKRLRQDIENAPDSDLNMPDITQPAPFKQQIQEAVRPLIEQGNAMVEAIEKVCPLCGFQKPPVLVAMDSSVHQHCH